MGLQDKIEEIKRKPEHVRIRYAWGLAIAFTLVVVIIWIISLAGNNEGSVAEPISPDAGAAAIDLNQPKESMKDVINNNNKTSNNSAEGFNGQ